MQTQTQTVRAKTTKKFIYTAIMVAITAIILAYIGCTLYFKFSRIDPVTMGTKFYSWRVQGADNSALKQKMDKFAASPAQKAGKTLMEKYIKDKYPAHLPRYMANHTTFAYPNIDMFLLLRQAIVQQQEAVVKGYKDGKETMLAEFTKVTDPTLFYTVKDWEGSTKVDKALLDFYARLDTAQREQFRKIANLVLTFITNMFSDDEATRTKYQYNGTEVPEQAVADLTKIIKAIGTQHLGNPEFAAYIYKNEDSDRLLKSLNIDVKKTNVDEIAGALARGFFEEAKTGVLYPYFSYGYSTILNTVLYLCLDLNNLDYVNDPEIDMSETIKAVAWEQKVAENKITAIGSAIAYGMAKNLSPTEEVSEETVIKNTNILVYYLFTSKLSSSPSTDESNLNKIIAHLSAKKTFIEGFPQNTDVQKIVAAADAKKAAEDAAAKLVETTA